MLAIMPEDHWASFDASPEEGWMLAGPWTLPNRMFINADAEGGSIEVEFLDAYEQSLPGLGRGDCTPVTANGKDQEVKWKNVARPADMNEDYRGGAMVRFYLRNAKLYSCTLADPDPQCEHRSYWANRNWNVNIFHRRDQWERTSNDPAGGVPPVTRGTKNY